MFGFSDNVDEIIGKRREVVFVLLSGIFLGSMAMLNILGISKFIDLSFELGGMRVPFQIAVGVLAYPITFLCTDFISELYGRDRANVVVWIGLLLNMWVLFILWVGGVLPPSEPVTLFNPESGDLAHGVAFYKIREYAAGATMASMVAYLAAQFCDVHIFHFLKKLTKGKHLWLRNNGSTLISQLVDTVAVILITHFYAKALPPVPEGVSLFDYLLTFIISGYVFKLATALVDTIPFYLGVKWLTKYLQIPKETYD